MFLRRLLFLFLPIGVFAQNQIDSVSLIFIGDIMGHIEQINAAYNPDSKVYNYDSVFTEITPWIESADVAIANLEVTLAGWPYAGYPQFSSPDALAAACKNSGIDILVTANNHSCDRGKKGILRTLKVLDSLEIPHTGTFADSADHENSNLLLIQKNNFKIGLLNYTYGTNGIEIPYPTKVNMIDTAAIKMDIEKAKLENLDRLIVFVHWGLEYKTSPSKEQRKIADFLMKNGVDIVIGSHPHVVQCSEYHPDYKGLGERFVVYSLGNFVSNQRTEPRDGGQTIKLTFCKTNGETRLADYGYFLTWVSKTTSSGKNGFRVLPCSTYEKTNYQNLDSQEVEKMIKYIQTARSILRKENLLVEELKF